jgi:alpha-ribazole phosphatase/probable phosphoglycerate mutase
MSGLLFIRHAQTDLAGTFCGHSDPEINACGRRQIRDLIERMAHETIDAIYSSDLRRAASTAESLSEAFAAPVTRRRGLREIHFGDWEGLTWNEIERRAADYARRWIEAFPNLRAPGGESVLDFEARVQDEVDHLLVVSEDKRIAVVTHGGVMRSALRTLCGCTGQDAWERTQAYCSFFAYDGARSGKLPLKGEST